MKLNVGEIVNFYICFWHKVLAVVFEPRFYASQIYNNQMQATSCHFWIDNGKNFIVIKV